MASARLTCPTVSLRVTVLGCDGSYPGPGGAGSGYLVRGGGVTVWLDAGPGTLANLQRHVSLRDVDAVVLTHEHPDHRSDLEGFAVACQYVVRRDGVPVYGPPGVLEHSYHVAPPAIDWRDVHDGETASIGGLRLAFSRTDHGPETLAVRIDVDEAGGASLGYSADTGPGWHLEALGPALDLCLCESTFTADHEGEAQHLSGAQAGRQGREAGVRKLVLTHLWPVADRVAVRAEAEDGYGGPVDLATPDLELVV